MMIVLILFTVIVLFYIVYIIHDYKSMVSEFKKKEDVFKSICKELDDLYKQYGGKR